MRLIQAAFPELKYLACYRYTVTHQNDDFTVDGSPDDPTMPLVARVPLRFGVPGLVADLRARLSLGVPMFMLIGFIGGNPMQPYFHSFEGAEQLGTITWSFIDAMMVGGSNLDSILDGVVHGRGIDPYTGQTYGALGVTTSFLRANKL
jgi:hypothetical protein